MWPEASRFRTCLWKGPQQTIWGLNHLLALTGFVHRLCRVLVAWAWRWPLGVTIISVGTTQEVCWEFLQWILFYLFFFRCGLVICRSESVCVCITYRVWLFGTPQPIVRPSGSSVHRILQARIPEWVAIPSSRGSSWPRGWTSVSYFTGCLEESFCSFRISAGEDSPGLCGSCILRCFFFKTLPIFQTVSTILHFC